MKYLILRIFFKLNLIISLVLVPIIIPILIKKKIKFVRLRRDTVGNSIEELFLYLNIFRNKKNKNHLFFFNDIYICNEYLNTIYKKNFRISILGIGIYYLSTKFNYFRKFLIEMPSWENLYKYKLKLKKFSTPYEFKFNKMQNEIGFNFLNKIGVKKNHKIVCLVVRDNFYKENFSNNKNKYWNYHGYRNAEINSYIKTIKYLNNKGFFVIRMGKGSNKSALYHNHLYFDYSMSNHRSDFLDFWIFSRAYMAIVTGTGIDELCHVFKIPTVDTNYFPIGAIRSIRGANITIFKKIKETKKNKFLNLTKIINLKFFRYPSLVSKYKKYKIVDNTSNEILYAAKELEFKISMNFKSKRNEFKIQDLFWKNFKNSKFKTKLYSQDLLSNFEYVYKNRNIHNSTVSNSFIKKNKWILK